MGSSKFKAIYKNGKMFGSIFEDGLTNLLNSDIAAETWIRSSKNDSSSKDWCGSDDTPFNVLNVE